MRSLRFLLLALMLAVPVQAQEQLASLHTPDQELTWDDLPELAEGQVVFHDTFTRNGEQVTVYRTWQNRLVDAGGNQIHPCYEFQARYVSHTCDVFSGPPYAEYYSDSEHTLQYPISAHLCCDWSPWGEAQAQEQVPVQGTVTLTHEDGSTTRIPAQYIPGEGIVAELGTSRLLFENGPCQNSRDASHYCNAGLPPFPECGYYGFHTNSVGGLTEYHDAYWCGGGKEQAAAVEQQLQLYDWSNVAWGYVTGYGVGSSWRNMLGHYCWDWESTGPSHSCRGQLPPLIECAYWSIWEHDALPGAGPAEFHHPIYRCPNG